MIWQLCACLSCSSHIGTLPITVDMTAVPKNLDDELGEVDEPPPIPPKCFSFDEELPPALPPQRMVTQPEVSDASLRHNQETGNGAPPRPPKLPKRNGLM